jgi:hypothetical protein
MKEQNLYKALQAKHSKQGILFRNNTGTAYQGRRGIVNGMIMLSDPRPISFGLCVGSSDLIGWTEIIVTPDLVGKKIAIFTAVEVKNEKGRATKEQLKFLQAVRNAGGIARLTRYIDNEFKNDEI